jgi:hypothetical protein
MEKRVSTIIIEPRLVLREALELLMGNHSYRVVCGVGSIKEITSSVVPDGPELVILGAQSAASASNGAAGVRSLWPDSKILQPRRRHGRHGLHREQQGLCMLSVLINTHMLMAAKRSRRRALLLRVVGLRLQRRQADRRPDVTASRKRTPTPRCRRTATAGRSCSASACAATSARTSASPRASRATTTSTARTAPTTAAARRRRPRSAARSSPPSSPASTRSRSGATASRPARSCTSTTASRARSRSPQRHHRAAQHRQRRAGHINQLVDIVEEIAGVKLKRNYKLDAPKGVRGRNSDNTLIKKLMAGRPPRRDDLGQGLGGQRAAARGGGAVARRRLKTQLTLRSARLEGWATPPTAAHPSRRGKQVRECAYADRSSG